MNDNKNNNRRPGPFKGIGLYALLFALVFVIVYAYRGSDLGTQLGEAEPVEYEFSQMVEQLEAENVTQIKVTAESRKYEGTLANGIKFIAYAPSSYDMAIVSENYIIPQSSAGLLVNSVKPSSTATILSFVPTLLLIGFMIFFWMSFSGGGAGGKGVMSFGKSHARTVKDGEKQVKFADVAGLDEEKLELAEIVDFLKSPKKYTDLGARIPKGVLLVGPPGTGKTLLAKAVAGEAGVQFLSISGSDFVELYVGVGASRVRDLFDQAKKLAPAIIFIDEIDAVGRQRGTGLGGGHDEREQTLNQLLVEMDGFSSNEGVIVMAATNRADILDNALLRPGRFDRQVYVGVPDVKGREAILKVHARGKSIGEDVDFGSIAKGTPGFTGADLENLLNEAALLAARRSKRFITSLEIEEAILKVIAGPEKKSRVITDKERKLTAYHEAGHAVAAYFLKNSDPVHQITIIPHGHAGGMTIYRPTEDRSYESKNEMFDRIVSCLGGRMAEKIMLDDISTGASSDIQQASNIARSMIMKYGFSEKLGPISFDDSSHSVFIGRDFSQTKSYSEKTAALIDDEVHELFEKAMERCEQIISEHKDILTATAEYLLEHETMEGKDFEYVCTHGGQLPPVTEEKPETPEIPENEGTAGEQETEN